MQHAASRPGIYVWLRPTASVRQALDAHRRRWWWPQPNHQPAAHRLHLTLHALGPLDDACIAQVSGALSQVRADCFDLELGWSGVWTGNGVAVACPRPAPALMRLHGALRQALPGARPRQGWSPHVTLAWRALEAGAALLDPLRWPVREFLLVRSWLPPHQTRHEVLGCYALMGPGAGPAPPCGGPAAPVASPPDTPCHQPWLATPVRSATLTPCLSSPIHA